MTQPALTSSPPFGKIFDDKKVLVTGHTGFKGAWLCEWLVLLGAKVTGYSIDCENPSLFRELKLSERLQDFRGDVRDPGALNDLIGSFQPDFVFHLAAQPLVRHSYTDPIGTFTTNVTGSINVMEAIRLNSKRCAVVMVTTDKVYENRETGHAYKETDPLGGHDPYSASKAAAEIAIDSYRKSFFARASGREIAMASARAGNVIGGGDWANDRLVPDCVRALQKSQPIAVRNRNATRPWQHVLDPLSGYLALAAALSSMLESKADPDQQDQICSAFNFGPHPQSNRTVSNLVDEVLKHWPGKWHNDSEPDAPHEAGLLNLNIDKAEHVLGWRPIWDFEEAVGHTISWYYALANKADALALTRSQIELYQRDANHAGN